ncbi:DUF5677 domain-containing protein [Pseudomonas sp. MBLB4123]|uniref:DUF5677 domain-containing protein n=1 Tax=Pseudomonas sp. MBLB4123 TaxID=3451557 RepID=UPI003F74C074
MDEKELRTDFETFGFLGAGIEYSLDLFRAENAEWFQLAEDLNKALVRTALTAMELAKTNLLAPQAIAVRILLRSCGQFQGVVLLASRGMVAESRTLARSVLEGAFAIAALHDNPEKFLALLREDNSASKKNQGKYILAERLVADPANEARLREIVESMGKVNYMTPKAIAALGPLTAHYLAYQRLSDDSAHISAKSLDRHVARNGDKSGWLYSWGPGSPEDNAATLHGAILGGMSIGVGVTAMLNDENGNAEFAELARRFQLMPEVQTI